MRMNRTSAKRATGPAGTGRLLLVAFMLLAFAVQGYVTQTHIHRQNDSAAILVLKAPGHAKLPLENPVNCPVCQQAGHAGQFVVPAWLAPFLILDAVSVIEIAAFEVPRFDAVSHNWRGRGPPVR